MRLAIIGCGAVFEQFQLPALKKIKVLPSVFIDKNIDVAKKYADIYNGKSYENYEDAINQFDAVIVSLPHFLHAPICLDLINNHKYIFVEKPFVTDYKSGLNITEIANKNNKPICVGNFRRYRKNGLWLKEFLDSEDLGNIEEFYFYEGGKYNWPVSTDSFWKKELAGGGVLFDTGAHTVDQMCWWLNGDIELLSYKDDQLGGVEADCSAEFKLANGAKGYLELSRTRNLGAKAIFIGSKGKIEIGLVDSFLKSEPKSLLEKKYAGINGNKIPVQSYVDLMSIQILKWMNAIKKKSSNYITSEDVLPSISLINNCYERREEWNLEWVKC